MRKMKGEKYARIHDAENAFFINYARYYFARDYKHDDNFAIIIHVNCELWMKVKDFGSVSRVYGNLLARGSAA